MTPGPLPPPGPAQGFLRTWPLPGPAQEFLRTWPGTPLALPRPPRPATPGRPPMSDLARDVEPTWRPHIRADRPHATSLSALSQDTADTPMASPGRRR